MEFIQRELPQENVNVSQVKPLKEFSALLVAIVLVFMTTLFVVGYGSGFLFALLPQRFEQKFLGNLSSFAVSDSTINDSIPQAVFSAIIAEAPGIAIDLHLVIVDDTTVNAYALPGGTIVLYSGLLSKIKSENELTFVLAHEIGHFAHRDHIRSIGSTLTVALFTTPILRNSDALNIASAVTTFESRHYSQNQELGADRYALEQVQRIYGHVHGASDLFSRFENNDNAYLLSTHPSTQKRLGQIERYLEEHQGEVGTIIPFDMNKKDESNSFDSSIVQ